MIIVGWYQVDGRYWALNYIKKSKYISKTKIFKNSFFFNKKMGVTG